MLGPSPELLDRRADAAGDLDVVVLDQDRVVQAEQMIPAPADAHRVLLQDAHAGDALAGVGQPGPRVGLQDLDVARGRGRDAG